MFCLPESCGVHRDQRICDKSTAWGRLNQRWRPFGSTCTSQFSSQSAQNRKRRGRAWKAKTEREKMERERMEKAKTDTKGKATATMAKAMMAKVMEAKEKKARLTRDAGRDPWWHLLFWWTWNDINLWSKLTRIVTRVLHRVPWINLSVTISSTWHCTKNI